MVLLLSLFVCCFAAVPFWREKRPKKDPVHLKEKSQNILLSLLIISFLPHTKTKMKTLSGLNNGTLTNKENIKQIVEAFPNGIDFAFGYGSGVFVQEENKVNTNQDAMVDLILSVSNVQAWHRDNLKKHYDHYAVLPRYFGPGFISMLQNAGAGCYFNPMVEMKANTMTCEKSRMVKYGVISHAKLIKDLTEWESMYVAGRMHKPILPINNNVSIDNPATKLSDEIMDLQQNYNLKYAITSALLLLPLSNTFQKDNRQVPMRLLFESIAGLSYIGDPRLAAGAEDPQKIKKLVNSSGQLERFKSMYSEQISRLERLGVMSAGTNKKGECYLEMDLCDSSVRRNLLRDLPKNVHFHMQGQSSMLPKTNSGNATIRTHQEIVSFAQNLSYVIQKIVGPPARIQSAKGLFTAGISKSLRYVQAKLAKGSLRNMPFK